MKDLYIGSSGGANWADGLPKRRVSGNEIIWFTRKDLGCTRLLIREAKNKNLR
jgi:hypothetical protein